LALDGVAVRSWRFEKPTMDVVETMAGRNMFKRKAGDIRNVNNVYLKLMLDILDILRLLLCL